MKTSLKLRLMAWGFGVLGIVSLWRGVPDEQVTTALLVACMCMLGATIVKEIEGLRK